MGKEMKALKHNDSWDLVFLTTNKQAIECKWIYIVTITEGAQEKKLKWRIFKTQTPQTK